MIPDLDPQTGLLPPGIHEATWAEVVRRFSWSPWRQQLLAGLQAGLEALRVAGCRRVYLDGSFVTAKESPGDFDACWESAGVTARLLDPVLLDFTRRRTAQKAGFGGESFIAESAADPHGTRFLDFFQRIRDGLPKGIVTLNLGGTP